MNTTTRALLSWLVCMALGSTSSPMLLAQDSRDSASFKLVIHADNPTAELEAARIGKMFLKKVPRWDGWDVGGRGVRVVPVDQVQSSPVRAAFSGAIHKKSVSAIKSYWQRMIFSGREVPPEELPDDAAVLAFVRANRGGVGYVAGTTALGEGLKELRIISD